MAYTDPLDPTTPADGEAAGQGDNRIRELKRALIERLETLIQAVDDDPLEFIAGIIPTEALANLAVETDKIADTAVTGSKLADNAVSTVKIVDDAVTAAKLADGAVGDVALANATKAALLRVAANLWITFSIGPIGPSGVGHIQLGLPGARAGDFILVRRSESNPMSDAEASPAVHAEVIANDQIMLYVSNVFSATNVTLTGVTWAFIALRPYV